MENEEKEQLRYEDALEHFKKFGFIMFPQNKFVYEFIDKNRSSGTLLEAGCGIGTGAYILGADVATDKLESNIKFAQQLYPDMNFDVWDIGQGPYKRQCSVVVCVETIEHVKNYKQAIKNLIESAILEVWISTPSPEIPERPPSNPFHVREFTEKEFLELIGDYKVTIPIKGLYKISL